MLAFMGLILWLFVIKGLLSYAGERLYKTSAIAAASASLFIISVNFAILFCEISEIGGLGVLFKEGFGQIVHPGFVGVAGVTLFIYLLIVDNAEWFGSWFGLAAIEAIVAFLMGASYYGTGKLLGSILVAAIGAIAGSIITEAFKEYREKKRRKNEIKEIIADSFKKALRKKQDD